jgi:hypothetical protein
MTRADLQFSPQQRAGVAGKRVDEELVRLCLWHIKHTGKLFLRFASQKCLHGRKCLHGMKVYNE